MSFYPRAGAGGPRALGSRPGDLSGGLAGNRPASLQPARSTSGQTNSNEAVRLLQLSPTEREAYLVWYREVRDPATGYVPGDAAASLLRRSNLYKDLLRQIWVLADTRRRGYLDQDEFFVALRLVAICQRGGEPSLDSLRRFRGMQLIPQIDPASASRPSAQTTPGAASAAQPRASSSTSANPGETLSWTPTYEQIAEYDALMRQYCGGGTQPGRHQSAARLVRLADLRMTGSIAREVFPKLCQHRLSSAILRDIWELADQDRDGQLDLQEFRCAAHLLTVLGRQPADKAVVPRPLPPALRKQSLRLRFGDGANTAGEFTEAAPSVPSDALSVISSPNAEVSASRNTDLAGAFSAASKSVEDAQRRLKELRDHLDLLEVRGRALAEKKRVTLANSSTSTLERIYAEEQAFVRDARGVVEACLLDLGGTPGQSQSESVATASRPGPELESERSMTAWGPSFSLNLQQLLIKAKNETARERAKVKVLEEELQIARRQIQDMVATGATAPDKFGTGRTEGHRRTRNVHGAKLEPHEPGKSATQRRAPGGQKNVSGSLLDDWSQDDADVNADDDEARNQRARSKRIERAAYRFSAEEQVPEDKPIVRDDLVDVPPEWSAAAEHALSANESRQQSKLASTGTARGAADSRARGDSPYRPPRYQGMTRDAATAFGAYIQDVDGARSRRFADDEPRDERPSERRRASRQAAQWRQTSVAEPSEDENWRSGSDYIEVSESVHETTQGGSQRAAQNRSGAMTVGSTAEDDDDDEWSRSASTAIFSYW
jgi:hypothetical protein